MSVVDIANDLIAKGEKAEVRDGKLFINGRYTPIVSDEHQPYVSDCPNGVCSV